MRKRSAGYAEARHGAGRSPLFSAGQSDMVSKARGTGWVAKGAWLLAQVLAIAAPGQAQTVPLSVDITAAAGEPWEDAVAIAREAGASVTSLSLFWDEIEPGGAGYAPAFDWPAIANAYYPSEGLALTVTFSVIDTVADRRRADLKSRRWDDPVVVDAFRDHVGDVLGRMPDTDIVAVAIGNEVDAHLSTAPEIAAFARFLAAARAAVHEIRPGVPVGTKLTFGALTGNPEKWRPLLRQTSGLMVTYYPLADDFSVRAPHAPVEDLPRIVAVDPALPIFLMEAGYPSAGCGSSPDAQQVFFETLIKEAGTHGDRIALVSLTWLTDIDETELDQYSAYYGVSDGCFRRFLASLGIRYADGTPKPALNWLFAPR